MEGERERGRPQQQRRRKGRVMRRLEEEKKQRKQQQQKERLSGPELVKLSEEKLLVGMWGERGWCLLQQLLREMMAWRTRRRTRVRLRTPQRVTEDHAMRR